jgi:hypothetical protein
MAPVIRFRCHAWLGLLVAIVVVAVGCDKGHPKAAEGKVLAKGRILKNGLPLKPSEKVMDNMPPGDPGLQVIFITLGTADAGAEIQARILAEPPGTFDLVGAEGKGIPPGKYRVVVFLGPFGGKDEFKGKYSRENSKIDVEVKPGEDVVIDLANFP